MIVGLDDARNTAKLCFRLVKDGCKLTITKSLLKRVYMCNLVCNYMIFSYIHPLENCSSFKSPNRPWERAPNSENNDAI